MQQTIKTSELSAEEICRLGEAIYDRDLKHKLEPAHIGEFVVIHVGTGDYFVDSDEFRAVDAASARYPDEVFFIGRIGFSTVDRIGIYHQG
ncbi:MAG: hypothetical protein ACRDI2_03430 [Chloroflexota bacterium]